MRDGVATIPWALYAYQGQLALQAPEVWFISAIMARKWDAELPHPSLRALASESGVSLRHLQNLKSLLCAKGFLTVRARRSVNGSQDANSYDFGELFAGLDAAILADATSGEHPLRDDNVPPRSALDPVDHSFAARYGRVVAGAGIIAIPGALYAQQAALGLNPQECWFITYILAFRWSDTLPYPSLTKMAERTGYSRQALLDIKDKLVERGLLRIEERFDSNGGQSSNGYDFSPLLERLNGILDRQAESSNAYGATESSPPTQRRITPRDTTPTPGSQGRSKPAPAQLTLPTITAGGVQSGLGGGMQSPLYGGVQSDIVGGIHFNQAKGMQSVVEEGMQSAVEGGMQSAGRRGDAKSQNGLLSLVGDAEQLRGPDANHLTGGDAEQLIGGDAEHFTQRRSDQEESDQEESKDSNRAHIFSNAQRYSPYIARIIQDYSNEFGDPDHWPANVSQAHRLWQESACGEADFVDMLHEARFRLRRYQGRQGNGFIANKMAYYFRVLQSLADDTATVADT